MNLKHFKFYTKADVLSLTSLRKFETKLGELIQTVQPGLSLQQELEQTTATYVLFGIPEDIGVQANLGLGGTSTAWLSFLQQFLNMQSNDFMEGEEVLLLGYFDFGDIQYLIDKMAANADEKLEAYRHAINTIDEEVESLAKAIAFAGKIPVAIGGGHNNAYPLIKGTAKGLQQSQQIALSQINCINLDAHIDYGPSEGRHSGNAFRYAEEDGFLQKYCVIGIHESQLAQNVWIDLVNNPFMDCISFEDIFIREKRSFTQAIAHAVAFTDDNFTGIELDLDAVQGVLSWSAGPCGVSPVQARQYVSKTAALSKPAYLHICEGAAQLQNGTTDAGTGKLIALLVSDFVKAVEELVMSES